MTQIIEHFLDKGALTTFTRNIILKMNRPPDGLDEGGV